MTPDIDDYPERALFAGTDPAAATVIVWFNQFDAMSDHLAEVIDAAFLAGGHALVLATTPDVLARAGAAVCLIAAPYLADRGDGRQPERVH